jgi:hypothetical protein
MASLFAFASLAFGIMLSARDGFSLSMIWVWICLLVGILAAFAYCSIYQHEKASEAAIGRVEQEVSKPIGPPKEDADE